MQLLQRIRRITAETRSLYRWARRDFASPAPQNVKRRTLARHSIPRATWIESGTYRGDTTAWLSSSPRISARAVVTIEPADNYFAAAVERFLRDPKVTVVQGESTDALPGLLSEHSGPLCFWLDGHYSSGDTYMGEADCPALGELRIISRHAQSNASSPLVVFIDDVRLFAKEHRETDEHDRDGYPPLKYLVEWAEDLRLFWTIEQDIFIAKSRQLV